MSEGVEANKVMHQELSDIFYKQNLSYKFTSVLMHKGTQFPVVHFAFSKPTKTKPVPEVVVTADVRPKGVGDDGLPRYSFAVEGQRYSRVLTLDVNNTTGNEINEKLIDKVFAQKTAMREHFL